MLLVWAIGWLSRTLQLQRCMFTRLLLGLAATAWAGGATRCAASGAVKRA